MPTPAESSESVREELASLRWGLRCAVGVAGLALTLYTLFRLSSVPKHGHLFEYLMGPDAVLPSLTGVLVRQYLPLLGATACAGVGGVFFAVTRRSAGAILMAGSVVALLLFVWLIAVEFAMGTPLWAILREFNGK